jgi:glycerophosphoryl diester phosphodiesterase
LAPPNTLAAFTKALELNADAIELDVHLSADHVPVVIHDFTVDDTTDGSGWVQDLTLSQLKQLDAGSWFDPAFAYERIPTLEEVFSAVGDQLLVNVELKTTSIRDEGLERTVLALIERHRLEDRVLISSFNPLALRRCKRVTPRVRVAILVAPELPLVLRRSWLGGLFPHEAYHPEHTMVDHRYVAWAHRRRCTVNTWTVNNPDEMERLIAIGVDGIITDRPGILHDIIDT